MLYKCYSTQSRINIFMHWICAAIDEIDLLQADFPVKIDQNLSLQSLNFAKQKA